MGRQAYVICPKVTKSDLTTKDGKPPSQQKLMMAKLKNVEDEVKLLQEKFPDFKIAGIHGKLSVNEKEELMQRFKDGEIDILVATSVIEVGVNVPNATTILIEGAERFGLAQLHQLRGRVLRSSNQAYCFLATTKDSLSENSKMRLQSLVDSNNGFELSEKDLELRGAGELKGDSQWGNNDVAMLAIKNIKMVEAARKEAELLVGKYDLNNFPLLDKHMQETEKIHFE